MKCVVCGRPAPADAFCTSDCARTFHGVTFPVAPSPGNQPTINAGPPIPVTRRQRLKQQQDRAHRARVDGEVDRGAARGRVGHQ